jgi:D-serine deaminase-like pyridoxal phosphate-dependent protein
MAERCRPSPGTPIDDLDTPCLILDMVALEHNMNVVADFYRDRTCKMRPHVKNHKSPLIAHMQIRAGGTVGGVCAAKVSEAEAMVQGGISDVFITNQVVTRDKIARLCALAGQADMKVACDNPQNVRDLSAGAQAAGTTLGVIIEVETGLHRCGVQSPGQGVELARLIRTLPGLAFRGVMSHQVLPPDAPRDRETRYTEGRRMIQICLDVKDAIEAAGIPVEVVSTGESWSYDVAGDTPGVTEVQGGSYLLMETSYRYMSEFQHAGKVLASVISTPRPGVAIGDAGMEAMGLIKGVPEVEGMPGVTVKSLDAQSTILQLEGDAKLGIGDKFTLLPSQQDAMISRWDQYIAVRNGKVEAVWDIPGRGRHS